MKEGNPGSIYSYPRRSGHLKPGTVSPDEIVEFLQSPREKDVVNAALHLATKIARRGGAISSSGYVIAANLADLAPLTPDAMEIILRKGIVNTPSHGAHRVFGIDTTSFGIAPQSRVLVLKPRAFKDFRFVTVHEQGEGEMRSKLELVSKGGSLPNLKKLISAFTHNVEYLNRTSGITHPTLAAPSVARSIIDSLIPQEVKSVKTS